LHVNDGKINGLMYLR